MFTAVRTRYLVAMGFVTPLTYGSFACQQAASRDTTPIADPSTSATPAVATRDAGPRVTGDVGDAAAPVATSDPTRDAAADDGELRRPKAIRDAGALWPVANRVPSPRPNDTPTAIAPRKPNLPRATCPNGAFCISATGTVSDDGGAPAPYGNCPLQVKRPDAPVHHDFRADLTKHHRAQSENACCYSWFEPCPGGRALRSEETGAPLVSPPVARLDWTEMRVFHVPAAIVDLDAETRATIARHWLREAATEHASVASFNRFSLQLLALGAPRDLVLGAQYAALDEIRHAEACYALAARCEDERRGPGPLPLPAQGVAVEPAIVAIETLRDGCIGESIAAHCARAASRIATDETTVAALAAIADDEERHAELAWKTVAWLIARFGAPVRDAVVAFGLDFIDTSTHELRRACETERSAASATEVYGVFDDGVRSAMEREGLREVVVPCLKALTLTTPRGSYEGTDAQAFPNS